MLKIIDNLSGSCPFTKLARNDFYVKLPHVPTKYPRASWLTHLAVWKTWLISWGSCFLCLSDDNDLPGGKAVLLLVSAYVLPLEHWGTFSSDMIGRTASDTIPTSHSTNLDMRLMSHPFLGSVDPPDCVFLYAGAHMLDTLFGEEKKTSTP